MNKSLKLDGRDAMPVMNLAVGQKAEKCLAAMLAAVPNPNVRDQITGMSPLYYLSASAFMNFMTAHLLSVGIHLIWTSRPELTEAREQQHSLELTCLLGEQDIGSADAVWDMGCVCRIHVGM